MSVKIISYLLAFLLVTVNSISADTHNNEVDDTEYFLNEGIRVYPGDRECTMVGGYCVHKNDCTVPTTVTGLCPSNQHRGVECCYELPVRPALCSHYGGECMNWCNPNLRRPSTDCADQYCCVLVT